MTGSLITLSVKGNIADLQGGRMLVLDIENGVPVARSRAETGERRSPRTSEEPETTTANGSGNNGLVNQPALQQTRQRVAEALGSETTAKLSSDDVYTLSLLDQRVLNVLVGVPDAQISQMIVLVQRDAAALNFLLGKYGRDIVGRLSPETLAQYLPDIIEVGAGEGNYSQFLRQEFLQPGEKFVTTDFAPEAGAGGFLLNAERAGISTRYDVDANQLDELFQPESIRVIVAANPYGAGPRNPGQSYGLARFTGRGQTTEADDRFLRSAYQVLQPGGKVIIRCKSNIMRDYINITTQIDETTRRILQSQFPKLGGTNPYTRVKPRDIVEFSRIGYEITVSSTSPPESVSFGRPDTAPGQGIELSAFNVEITFKKSDTPKVTYVIGNQQFEEIP